MVSFRVSRFKSLPVAALFAFSVNAPARAQAPTPAPAAPPATVTGTQPPQAGPTAGAPPTVPVGQVSVPQVVVKPSEPRRASAPKRPPNDTAPAVAKAAPQAIQPQTPAAPVQSVAQQNPPQLAPGAPNVYVAPASQPVTTIDRTQGEATPVFSASDLLQAAPGISIKQGNGPRDQSISIRGSNARNGFGVRNIVVLEDGFAVTQPDGLSRTDITDPRAYGGIDVYRGPSSVLFGNYATGGAVNFRARTGGEINGYEQGVDVGSFGYLNNYMTLGAKSGGVEASLFMSDVRGDGFIRHSAFNTQTTNFLMTLTPSSADRITLKVIDNLVEGDLSVRLSLDQFKANPFQRGCISGSSLPAGCGSVSLFNNGFNGTKANYSADQAGLNRDDRRTIAGIRWEHDFDPNTTLRTQFVFDNRNINQPTGTTSAIGVFPSINMSSDITNRGQIFGLKATSFVGVYYNSLDASSDTVNVMPGGNATLGRLTNRVYSETENFGARVREELAVTRELTGVLGASIERSLLRGHNVAFSYPVANNPATTQAFTWTDREFNDTAKEAGLVWRPNDAWAFRGRVATAYGIPQVGNMFTLADGTSGNNTGLKPQTNVGYDLGFDWTPSKAIKVSMTGFYEFFTDELVTQNSPVAGRTFTFNAPKSEHRGVEIAADWRFLPGWRFTAAYTYLDEVFTEYTEQLGSGATFSKFNRAGNKIPGVSPNELLARLGYDQTWGPLKGWGAFAEWQWKDDFFVDNGNILKVPGYDLVNLNVHYTGDVPELRLKGLTWFAEVKNVFDKTYIASANNITNSLASAGVQNSASVLSTTGTGSIYAGSPRAVFTGFKVKF